MRKSNGSLAVFDAEAANYDAWYRSRLGSFVDMVETKLAFEMLPVQRGHRVLDAGCGTGNFSRKLALKGCLVTGIDISPKMVEMAKAQSVEFGEAINYLVMDAHRLDFPDECFDAVLSMAAVEFLRAPRKALGEMLRVAKKGGGVLIGTINGNSKWGKLYSDRKFADDSVYKHASFVTPENLRKMGKESPVDLRQCLFVPPDTQEERLSLELENELSRVERGGFLCALWQKL